LPYHPIYLHLISTALTELDRLNHQIISFKDIITGGWALKFQAIQDLEWVLLWLDRASRRRAR